MLQAGQNIKAIRELMNFTQDYVASRLNMSIPNYSNIETGKTELTLTRLQQIAGIFQIDYRQILNLNRAQILSLDVSATTGNDPTKSQGICDELVKQLKIKDEQINRLLSILEKKNSGGD
jgi:transcriptional regulator with XRE-family HTH domain